MPPSSLVRRALVLATGVALTAVIYVAQRFTPPGVDLGLFYLLPPLFVAWYQHPLWSVPFAVGAIALRLTAELAPGPPIANVPVALMNQIPFAVLAGFGVVATWRARRAERRTQELTTHDALTGVLNVRAFTARLVQELERNRRYARPLALLVLDLDNFKTVNHARGHQTGDAVLRLVADAIRRAMRGADVVGRLGGDEFAVLMPETPGPDADAVAQRLAVGLARAFSGSPTVTASIGVVSCTASGAGVDDVLRSADQAMYQAKRAGKNRVVKVEI